MNKLSYSFPSYIIRVVFLIVLQSVAFVSFSQDKKSTSPPDEQVVEMPAQIAIHTYTVTKLFTARHAGYLPRHLAADATMQLVWETLWFRCSAIMLLIGCVLFAQRFRVRKIQKMKREFEMSLKHKDEEIIVQGKNMKMQSGSLRNLNEQIETLQKELAIQIEKTNSAEMAKNSFLAMVSYGVRTPLNNLGEASALLSLTSLSDEQQEYTDTIRECSDQLLAAVNDIFDFAKIESGQIKLEEKEFDLRRSIEDVMETFAGKASETDLDLVYNLAPEVPTMIVGDNFRLKQVLVSLIANMLKFTPEIEDILISVRKEKSDNNLTALCFEIHNTGIGIHYESAVSMFKSFSQTDYNETDGGTGLGLANCENLVRLMGGTIAMENHRGKGTSFSFTINVKTNRNSIQTIDSFNLENIEGKKVLVVHNRRNSLMSLQNQLSQWKMEVTIANSGFVAMKMLSEGSVFDIVITDLKMQGFDGVQLAQAIRKFHATLPVILLSPIMGSDQSKREANLFSSIISKPVRQAILYKNIQKGVQTFERMAVG